MDAREVINGAFALAMTRQSADEAAARLLALAGEDPQLLERAHERFLHMVDDLPGDAVAQRALVLLRLAMLRAEEK